MNNFRIFFFSVLVPLITVTLCATGESYGNTRIRHVLISQVKSRKLPNASLPLHPGSCPSHGCTGNLTTLDKPRVKRSVVTSTGTEAKENGNLPHYSSPLKLEIRSIKNATRADSLGLLYDETGRHAPGYLGYPPGHINEDMLLSWFIEIAVKIVSSYVFVYAAKAIFGLILYSVGLDDTYLETQISLGNAGKHPFEHYGNKGSSGGGGGGGGWKKADKGTYSSSTAWHHPASVWYQQPTYQYHKGGKKYELLGYDQHQAVKFAKKFAKKYAKKSHKYGLIPKPIGPYIPAYQQHKPHGWGSQYKR